VQYEARLSRNIPVTILLIKIYIHIQIIIIIIKIIITIKHDIKELQKTAIVGTAPWEVTVHASYNVTAE
jgi:hypothetical protein